MSTPNPKTRYFLCQLRTNIEHYDKSGFLIVQELDGPEIPSGLNRAGYYMVLEIVRRCKVDATTIHKTEEFAV